MLKLGQTIKELRKCKGWTQQQLGDELGMTQHTVSQWENGHRVIDLETFQHVLHLLGGTLEVQSPSLHLNEASYRLEPSTYLGDALEMTIEPNYMMPDGKEIYTVILERSGLQLILPEFFFGKGDYSEEDQQAIVLQSLALDYAAYENFPTLASYLDRGCIGITTEKDIQTFELLKHDMETALLFFDVEELANIELD